MRSVVRNLLLLVFLLLTIISIQAQQQQPMQMVSLHPDPQLRWQRISPTSQKPDGPVLYQLLLNASGTPGTVPVFDSNPRHLINSPITVGGGNVAIGGLSINGSSGVISFAGSQTFAGNGSGLTNLNGAQVTGAVATASNALQLNGVSTYARTDLSNTFNIGTQAIQTGAAGTVGLVVQGAGAQTANLQEWRNNGGTAVASVSASGAFSGDGSGLTNLSSSQLVDGGINREQIALLKWYAANQTTSFAVGAAPNGVAFDGANIWVANFSSNNVSKLRASDGAVLGTFAVGAGPSSGVAFDGANIWVTNGISNNVSKLRASDGAPLGTFTVGTGPSGVAFDGANIWVANFSSNTVSKLRASDGTVLGTVTVGTGPYGVAFDGANIWVTNNGSNTVSKLRASDGAVLGTFTVGTSPYGVAFDGANIWVTNFTSNTVSKLRASDGAVLGTFTVGVSPQGIAFDGANIWVANGNSSTVSKL